MAGSESAREAALAAYRLAEHPVMPSDLPAIRREFGLPAGATDMPCPHPRHGENGNGKAIRSSCSFFTHRAGHLWTKCHSEQCSPADIMAIVAERIGGGSGNGGPDPEARPADPLPSAEQVAESVARMRRRDDDVFHARERLLKEAGWPGYEDRLADELGVGYDGSITPALKIHVPDAAGELVNVISYRPGAPPHLKIRSLAGRPRDLFPRPEGIADTSRVYLCEGEGDGITARLAGLSGVGYPGLSFDPQRHVERFRRFDEILVVADCHDAGRAKAAQVAEQFRAVGIRAAVGDIAPERNDKHDVRALAKETDLQHVAEHLTRVGDQAFASLDSPTPSQQRNGATVTQSAFTPAEPLYATPPELATVETALLSQIPEVLQRCGVSGEARIGKILYLTVTSRLLQRPGNAACKGPSAVGKSYMVSKVLELFPPEAYYALSGMSERALIYSNEPLRHRMLVLYEATGMSGDWASYLIRSLLSEGRVRYETVEQVKGQQQARLIEREGPTGLIVTTTATALDAELETRLLSMTVTDTPDQTREVMRAQAEQATGANSGPPDLQPWHDLQRWLAAGAPYDVIVPFAPALATLIPPVAVRLRRDFTAVLTLVKAHALLHSAQREIDERDRVVATLDDYAAVRDLVADLLAEGVQTSVPQTVRETINAVADHYRRHQLGMNLTQLATALNLDKSSASRRASTAIEASYILNRESKLGQPARLEPIPGMRLPEASAALLPHPDELTEEGS